MNRIGNYLWGIVLIFIGVVFGLNALGYTNITIFFNGWWTLFIIVPCFIDLFKNGDKTGNIIGLLIGVGLLLGCNDLIDFSLIWKLFFPIILVVIGLSIIFKDTINKNVTKRIKELGKDNQEDYYATFSSQDLNFDKESFKGCNLNAVFGGIKCDLTTAKIKSDVVINTSCIFGGITIIVPDDVNVKISSIPIFGGVSDDRKKRKNDNEITIYVKSTCMFGGVEIK